MTGVQTCALPIRSEEHTSELQSHDNLVCRLLPEKKTDRPAAALSEPRLTRPPPPPRRRARPVGPCAERGVGVGFVRGLAGSVLVFFFVEPRPQALPPPPPPPPPHRG